MSEDSVPLSVVSLANWDAFMLALLIILVLSADDVVVSRVTSCSSEVPSPSIVELRDTLEVGLRLPGPSVIGADLDNRAAPGRVVE
jgi:hypothetical protein